MYTLSPTTIVFILSFMSACEAKVKSENLEFFSKFVSTAQGCFNFFVLFFFACLLLTLSHIICFCGVLVYACVRACMCAQSVVLVFLISE